MFKMRLAVSSSNSSQKPGSLIHQKLPGFFHIAGLGSFYFLSGQSSQPSRALTPNRFSSKCIWSSVIVLTRGRCAIFIKTKGRFFRPQANYIPEWNQLQTRVFSGASRWFSSFPDTSPVTDLFSFSHHSLYAYSLFIGKNSKYYLRWIMV